MYLDYRNLYVLTNPDSCLLKAFVFLQTPCLLLVNQNQDLFSFHAIWIRIDTEKKKVLEISQPLQGPKWLRVAFSVSLFIPSVFAHFFAYFTYDFKISKGNRARIGLEKYEIFYRCITKKFDDENPHFAQRKKEDTFKIVNSSSQISLAKNSSRGSSLDSLPQEIFQIVLKHVLLGHLQALKPLSLTCKNIYIELNTPSLWKELGREYPVQVTPTTNISEIKKQLYIYKNLLPPAYRSVFGGDPFFAALPIVPDQIAASIKTGALEKNAAEEYHAVKNSPYSKSFLSDDDPLFMKALEQKMDAFKDCKSGRVVQSNGKCSLFIVCQGIFEIKKGGSEIEEAPLLSNSLNIKNVFDFYIEIEAQFDSATKGPILKIGGCLRQSIFSDCAYDISFKNGYFLDKDLKRATDQIKVIRDLFGGNEAYLRLLSPDFKIYSRPQKKLFEKDPTLLKLIPLSCH